MMHVCLGCLLNAFRRIRVVFERSQGLLMKVYVEFLKEKEVDSESLSNYSKSLRGPFLVFPLNYWI